MDLYLYQREHWPRQYRAHENAGERGERSQQLYQPSGQGAVRREIAIRIGVSMIHTCICDLFGIDHPIISAPMAGTATAALAAAVSEAGGLGLIGGTMGNDPDWL